MNKEQADLWARSLCDADLVKNLDNLGETELAGDSETRRKYKALYREYMARNKATL